MFNMIDMDVLRQGVVGAQVVFGAVLVIISPAVIQGLIVFIGAKNIIHGLLHNPAVRQLQREWPRWSEIRWGRPGVPMATVFPPKVRSHRPHGRHELHREALAIEPAPIEVPVVVDPVAVVAAEPEPAGRHFGPHWMAPTGKFPAVYVGRHFPKGEQVTNA